MDKEQIAGLFMRGQDCSQVVLSHYAEKIGITEEEANRAAAAFGGGMGVGEVCGAVVGAMAVLGYLYGHKGPDDMDQRNAMIAARAAFLEKWSAKRSSCRCNDLLGHDIGTPEGFQEILDEGLLFSFCPELVMDAIAVTDEVIAEEADRQKAAEDAGEQALR